MRLTATMRRICPRSFAAPGRHRSAETLPRREIEMGVDRHHDDAERRHRVNIGADRPKPAEAHEYHGETAYEQDGDAEPDPRKEAREDALPERQADYGFQRTSARPQNQIGEEHAANPDDGSQSVECNSNSHSQLSPMMILL